MISSSKSEQLFRMAMQLRLNCIVYSIKPVEDVFKEFDSSLYVITDESGSSIGIEEIIMDDNDERTIVYCPTEGGTLWNKVFTMLLMHPNKHIVVYRNLCPSDRKLEVMVEATQLLKAVIALF